MRLVTFSTLLGSDNQHRPGLVVEGKVVDLGSTFTSVLEIVDGGDDALQEVAERGAAASTAFDLGSVALAAPIPVPRRNLLCMGLNYAEHVAEGAEFGSVPADLPEKPVWFTKATTSICGPYDDIVVPQVPAETLDWEVELAVVIGRSGRAIRPDEALDHVFGFTVLNDISLRDLQLGQGGQWFKGKSLDRCSPLGPVLVTRDEIPDPTALELSCSVNGEVMQRASAAAMIFDIATAMADISEAMTLLPGDIIATGTPSGVGLGQTPPRYLADGDLVVSSIPGIGELRNRVVVPAR